MVMESWSSELVIQWLVNIGLGHFATVLNADTPFTGRELERTSVSELGRLYKIDKKPAKKIIKERNNALAYLNVKPSRKRSKDQVEIGYPFGVVHVVHVEFIPGKGLKGLPPAWKQQLQSDKRDSVFLYRKKKRESPKRRRSSVYDFCMEDVQRWSAQQVTHWLELVDMAIFIPDFEDAAINGEILISASYTELATKLKIENDSLSRQLFQHITKLRDKNKRRSKPRDGNNNNNNGKHLPLHFSHIEISQK